MEQLHNHAERKESFNHLKDIEIKEVLLGNEVRAVIMPNIHTDICRRTPLHEHNAPKQNTLSIFTSESGLSNYGPMGPDTLRKDVGEYFRMMNFEEMATILTSENSTLTYIRSQLLISYLLKAHIRDYDSLGKKKSFHDGGWGGIMTDHIVRLDQQHLYVSSWAEQQPKSQFSGDDSHTGFFVEKEQVEHTKIFNLERIFREYDPLQLSLKQVNKYCPDLVEELFGGEFEELPNFIQISTFDLPHGDIQPNQWQPLSLSLSLGSEKSIYSHSKQLNRFNILGTCIGADGRFAGRAWWISK